MNRVASQILADGLHGTSDRMQRMPHRTRAPLRPVFAIIPVLLIALAWPQDGGQRFRWDQDFRPSQVIFIGLTEKKHLGPILSSVKGAGVLTVSDVENFSSSGGMIGFVFNVDRIRFEINLDPAVDSHISISSKLLSLASAVKGNALANKPVPENRCWTISAGSFTPFSTFICGPCTYPRVGVH
jgi:hypothetical protein